MVLQQKLYSIEEFEAFIARPENSQRRFELINGEIVEKVPTEEHGFITSTLHGHLWSFVTPRNLGRLVIEVRYRPTDKSQNDRLPDISFTSAERLKPLVTQGAAMQWPDLAIEIKSPDDSLNVMREKAQYYLSVGVRLVWLLIPQKKLNEVYRLNGDAEILTADEMLSGEDVLPGFSVRVSDIFPK